MSVELIDEPLPFVCYFVVRVVKTPETMHIVAFPAAVKVTPLLVVEFALAVSHSPYFFTLIPASIFVLLDNILPFYVFSFRLLIELRNHRNMSASIGIKVVPSCISVGA